MDEARPAPLSGFALIFATFTVALGTFLITLDQFIANVSIPWISGSLGVSQDNGSWVITSFTVSSAIMIPVTGWLTARVGLVRLFCVEAVLFSVASFFCGSATSFPELVVFRVIQGAVSGALIPLSQTLLILIYPPEKKGVALGFWGLVVMIGPCMGPVLGGWITDNYGWPWIFYINVPTGLFAGITSYFLLRNHYETPIRKIPLDKWGLLLFAIAIGCFQVTLDKGQDLDWFASIMIRILVVTSALALLFFIIWESFEEHPIIEFRFFKSRNFTLGTLMTGLILMLVFGSTITFPLWVQQELGYTSLWSGLTLAPLGLFAVILFPLLGLYQKILDPRIWIAVGMGIFIYVFWGFSQLYPEVSFWAIAKPRLWQGAAFALFYLPLVTLSLSGIPAKDLPSATGINSFFRMLFVGIGVSASVTYWTRKEGFYQSRLTEFVIPSNPAFAPYMKIVTEDLGLQGATADAFLYDVTLKQAYTLPLLDFAMISMWVLVAMLPLLLLFRSPKAAAKHATHVSE